MATSPMSPTNEQLFMIINFAAITRYLRAGLLTSAEAERMVKDALRDWQRHIAAQEGH